MERGLDCKSCPCPDALLSNNFGLVMRVQDLALGIFARGKGWKCEVVLGDGLSH